jgi:GR25 family glycosyltransferase involved in LPS biosynthesis
MKIFIVSPYFSCTDPDKKTLLKERLYRLFDRLENAKMLLYKNGKFDLSNIKILGVDGENYSTSLDTYLSDNWRNSFLRKLSGTKGCSLSHIKILKYIEEKNIQEDILILEDDALINKNFLNLIPKVFPDDYDIFLMHCYHQKNYDIQPVSWSENIKKITEPYTKNVGSWGAYTYFINGRNIKKIIKEILPLKWQIDHSLTGGENPNINTYILNPILEASADEHISYRKMLNTKDIVYHMEIQEKPPYILGQNKVLTLNIHETMINDVLKLDPPLFNFYIEDENNNLFLINTFIELEFSEKNKNIFTTNESEFDIVKFKIKNNNIFENNKKFKLHIIYVHSEGLHGIKEDIRKQFLKDRDSKFNQHIRYPNAGKEIILTINFTFLQM